MPVQYRIRSVAVVLPASMCAMMPKLRTLLRSVSTSFCATEVFPLFRLLGCCCCHARSRDGGDIRRGGRFRKPRLSPAVVSEGSVRLGHLVGILASLHRGTQPVARVED